MTPDQTAAHEFLTELRTRISTQPLPYQHGVEARALESMWEVFGQARDAIKKNPGCEKFAARTADVLNLVVRPLTAKWHRALVEGRLNSRDGADEFRGELRCVQEELSKFAEELHEMAYGKRHKDALTPDVMTDADIEALFASLAFGFTAEAQVPNDIAKKICDDEAHAVQTRREKLLAGDPRGPRREQGKDAIGLALSGGGIRSATFGLGFVQVLAQKRFLREVDFLSTVSGGGYTGCFLTQRLGGGEDHSTVAAPHGPDPEPIRYLRQHARFLSASNLKEKWSMVTATLAGMLLNWTAPLLVILVLALAANWIKSAQLINSRLLLVGCGWLSVLALVAYGCAIRLGQRPSLVVGRLLGGLLAITGVISAGCILELIVPSLPKTLGERWGASGAVWAVLVAATAAAPGIIRFVPVLKEPKVRKLVLKSALRLAGLLIPLIALVLFYTLRRIAEDHFSIAIGVVVALAVVSIFVLNINLTGPHRLYRDSLARTFIQKGPDDPPVVRLADINAAGTAPYHLINAALNVPSSQSSALKDRGCDFFLFSKNWIGSTAAGYRRTNEWKANGDDVDLATAMAVSGAAASSYMGLGSMPTLTALLTLLNARLGFWIKKPGAGGFAAPGFRCLLRETLGFGLSEDAQWLNLSDGGHIENLAVYELLRRRCKFIICVDGEADPSYTFHGLLTLVRHAQIDFGVRIVPTLDDLRPDPKTTLSKSHFHLCRIHYPEGTGLLLYIKLSVTGNESELIKRYRINNPEFPHQTTLDQFFDQEQFEAYRQLGVHVSEGLFLAALMRNVQPSSVRNWFEQLANSVLEPIKV